MMAERKKILVVDDHPLLRQGLARLIDDTPDLQTCAEAATAEETLEAARRLRPDLALVDIRLGKEDGMALVRRLRAEHGDIAVLVLTYFEDPVLLKQSFEAGAGGFMTKSESPSDVLRAIRRVLEGHTFISERMMDSVADMVAGSPAAPHTPGRLTDRESQILELIGQGLPPRQIAERLFLSVHTVHSHRESLKKKLGLAATSDLHQFAAQWVADRRTAGKPPNDLT